MRQASGEHGQRAPGARRSDVERNEQALVRAATTALHREGPRVTLATIAKDAGVGIGTLYRHFPTREHLLVHLTHRSFEQVLINAQNAERLGVTPTDSLRLFVEAAIEQRNELVLPLHGGPPLVSPSTRALQKEVREIVQRILNLGRADGSLKDNLTPADVVVFGSMLSQPHELDPAWDDLCRRLLANYLDGLAPTSGKSTF